MAVVATASPSSHLGSTRPSSAFGPRPASAAVFGGGAESGERPRSACGVNGAGAKGGSPSRPQSALAWSTRPKPQAITSELSLAHRRLNQLLTAAL